MERVKAKVGVEVVKANVGGGESEGDGGGGGREEMCWRIYPGTEREMESAGGGGKKVVKGLIYKWRVCR